MRKRNINNLMYIWIIISCANIFGCAITEDLFKAGIWTGIVMIVGILAVMGYAFITLLRK